MAFVMFGAAAVAAAQWLGHALLADDERAVRRDELQQARVSQLAQSEVRRALVEPSSACCMVHGRENGATAKGSCSLSGEEARGLLVTRRRNALSRLRSAVCGAFVRRPQPKKAIEKVRSCRKRKGEEMEATVERWRRRTKVTRQLLALSREGSSRRSTCSFDNGSGSDSSAICMPISPEVSVSAKPVEDETPIEIQDKCKEPSSPGACLSVTGRLSTEAGEGAPQTPELHAERARRWSSQPEASPISIPHSMRRQPIQRSASDCSIRKQEPRAELVQRQHSMPLFDTKSADVCLHSPNSADSQRLPPSALSFSTPSSPNKSNIQESLIRGVDDMPSPEIPASRSDLGCEAERDESVESPNLSATPISPHSLSPNEDTRFIWASAHVDSFFDSREEPFASDIDREAGVALVSCLEACSSLGAAQVLSCAAKSEAVGSSSVVDDRRCVESGVCGGDDDCSAGGPEVAARTLSFSEPLDCSPLSTIEEDPSQPDTPRSNPDNPPESRQQCDPLSTSPAVTHREVPLCAETLEFLRLEALCERLTEGNCSPSEIAELAEFLDVGSLSLSDDLFVGSHNKERSSAGSGSIHGPETSHSREAGLTCHSEPPTSEEQVRVDLEWDASLGECRCRMVLVIPAEHYEGSDSSSEDVASRTSADSSSAADILRSPRSESTEDFIGHHFVRPVVARPEGVPRLLEMSKWGEAEGGMGWQAELVSPKSPHYQQELLLQVAEDLMRTTDELRDVCTTTELAAEREASNHDANCLSLEGDVPEQQPVESIRQVLSSELAVLHDELQGVRYGYSAHTSALGGNTTPTTGLTSRCSLDSNCGNMTPWELTTPREDHSAESSMPGLMMSGGQARPEWERSPRASLSRQILRLQRGICLLQQEIESGMELSDARQMIAMTRELGILRATITAAFDQRVQRIEEQLECNLPTRAVPSLMRSSSARHSSASEPSSPPAALSPRSTVLDPGYIQRLKRRNARRGNGVRFSRQSLPEEQLSQSASWVGEPTDAQKHLIYKTMSDSFIVFSPLCSARAPVLVSTGRACHDSSAAAAPQANRVRSSHTRRSVSRSMSSPDMSGRAASTKAM